MSLDTTLQAPPHHWRTWLAFGVSVLAAGVIGAVLALAIENGTRNADTGATKANVPVSSAATDARHVPSIMSLTPAGLAAGVLGTSYTLPTEQHGPTLASVLASMSPETRRYTEQITSLTFAQLAAGAAGSP